MSTTPSQFPCVEATRCLMTEEEMGMRLTVEPFSSSIDASYIVTFSKERSTKEEWYVHLEYCRSDGDGNGGLRRVLQLRHSTTGKYLSCTDTGRVNCVDDPSPSTYWWLEPVEKKGLPEAKSSPSSSPRSLSESVDDSTALQYTLMSRQYAPRRLTYTTNVKGFTGSQEDIQLIASKHTKEPSIWTLKFTSGELCFISNPVVHCQLRCNTAGTLSMNNAMNGWEVFRFIEVGNGDLYISSWTHYTKFLTSDSDGGVDTIDYTCRALGHCERWRLDVPPGSNGVHIQNVASRRYLSVGRNANEALWTTTKPNDYALWHLDAAHSHTYYLTSLFASSKKEVEADEESTEEEIAPEKPPASKYNQMWDNSGVVDMHVSSSKTGPFLTKNMRNWEEWKVEMTPDGDLTFFSVVHEKYLGCNSKGDVHTTTSKGAWSIWEKKVSPHGGVMFLSREHLRVLAVNEVTGTLFTTPGDEETSLCHSWRLDPRLPRSVNGGKVIGVMGLAISIAMPFAVLGAMEAVGATITELALLGTSVEALAAAAAGAAIGAGLVGTAAKLVSDANPKEQSPSELSEAQVTGPWEENIPSQRPVSAWRSWSNFGSEKFPTFV
mmetsp:Transcript_17481/g.48272  ORF Transcript_17481/g.48272 Transcript_17481/m.48272 type:complete len:605 (+) Transcript_17481:234-2048(+)